MYRRDFLKTSLNAGLTLGAGYALNPLGALWAADESANTLPYDLVAVKNGSPEQMFDAGIAALGGMGTFVKPGQTVVVKPNIGWDVPPELAANTNPRLVQRIIEHCLEAKAKAVYVFDYTCDDWQRSYRTSGIETAARQAGAKVAPGDGEKYFHPVKVGGRNLLNAKEHELILQSDVFINVPVLKSHGSATLTVAMKNLMGIIWDRRFWHRNDLHQCIADFACYRRPTLNVVDAYNVMMRNGPRGGSEQDVARMQTQLISTDMVAVDAAAAKLFGAEPQSIPYIRLAAAQGAGRLDLEKLRIQRIRL